MAASAFKDIEERRLREGMAVLGVRVQDYWKLNAEYLGLLTKSEIEALAAEIGLKDVMGEEGLKKALALKKDQAVAALLGVEGFAYEGVVPKAMRYEQEGGMSEESLTDADASAVHAGDAGEEEGSELVEA